MRRIGSYEAKTRLPRLLDEVAESGEAIEITKRGVPIAILGPVTHDRDRDVGAAIDALRAFRSLHPLRGVTNPGAHRRRTSLRKPLEDLEHMRAPRSTPTSW